MIPTIAKQWSIHITSEGSTSRGPIEPSLGPLDVWLSAPRGPHLVRTEPWTSFTPDIPHLMVQKPRKLSLGWIAALPARPGGWCTLFSVAAHLSWTVNEYQNVECTSWQISSSCEHFTALLRHLLVDRRYWNQRSSSVKSALKSTVLYWKDSSREDEYAFWNATWTTTTWRQRRHLDKGSHPCKWDSEK